MPDSHYQYMKTCKKQIGVTEDLKKYWEMEYAGRKKHFWLTETVLLSVERRKIGAVKETNAEFTVEGLFLKLIELH